MKKLFFLILLIISCPRPGIKKIPKPDYLKEAQRTYQQNPLYAFALLKDSVIETEYTLERVQILAKIYLHQREYERAAALLDSINWLADLTEYETNVILIRTKRWNKLSNTSDTLLKGIAYYHLNETDKAIAFLSQPSKPDDYRMIHLAKAYESQGDFEKAFGVLAAIDTVSTYLNQEYQNLLFNIFLNYQDLTIVQKEIERLKKPHLQEFILLKIYEKVKNNKNLKKTAWKLVRKYPDSDGAYYAINFIKPTTKSDHRACGKVYYYHGNYNKGQSFPCSPPHSLCKEAASAFRQQHKT